LEGCATVEIQSNLRCIDETGYIQPTLAQLVAIRGSNGPFGSIYHPNAIQSWGVAADGSVTNVHA
jgi:sulfane dehydrogenase subunit SoxC